MYKTLIYKECDLEKSMNLVTNATLMAFLDLNMKTRIQKCIKLAT